MFSWFRNSRRKKLLAQPFPEAWRETLDRNVGHFAILPPELQAKLKDTLRILMAERDIVGVEGLNVTEEMKVTVLAQAALLLLGVEGYFFDKLGTIYLYPRSIKARLTKYQSRLQGGVSSVVDEDALNLGDAWHDRRIRLSWPSVLRGGRGDQYGQNLVLHEFAHHLDRLDGFMEGIPPQETAEKQRRWESVLKAEYERLLDDVEHERETLLDPYGTENEAEFFAVATECFYERPDEMQEEHPALYEILRDFYHVDPATWV